MAEAQEVYRFDMCHAFFLIQTVSAQRGCNNDTPMATDLFSFCHPSSHRGPKLLLRSTIPILQCTKRFSQGKVSGVMGFMRLCRNLGHFHDANGECWVDHMFYVLYCTDAGPSQSISLEARNHN